MNIKGVSASPAATNGRATLDEMTKHSEVRVQSEAAAGSPARKAVSVEFVSNLVTQPFGRLKGELRSVAEVEIRHADFDQVFQTLNGTSDADLLIVHLDRQWFFDLVPGDAIRQRTGELIAQCERWLATNPGSLVLNTIAFLPRSPIISERNRQARLVAEANAELFAFADRDSRVSVLDLAAILASLGYESALRERNRHVMRFPYSPDATKRIVAGYAELIRSMSRARRKAVVVDADNTLWNGVIGEVGYEGIGIDDEFPNVIHKQLQSQLLELKRLGYLLCVVTKNNETDFLEAFAKRSMPLSLDDLVTYRANWTDKSENLRSIAEELNIGIDALVFIDDNPFEIEEVRARLPEVDCQLFPKDDPEQALLLVDRIESLTATVLTSEDLAKTEQYRAESRRKLAAESASSIESYLASLDIKLTVSVNHSAHVPRITQLINKTNQFNLTTMRRGDAEVVDLMARGKVYDFRVEDRFGDMSIVGVAIVVDGVIDTFLMSCRALGRRLETEMLRIVTDDADQPLEALYVASSRNGMTAEFYEQNGFELIEETDGKKHYRQANRIQPVEYVTVVAN